MKIKEPFSAVSHAIGAVLAILALILLIRESIDPTKQYDSTRQKILYTASAIYHWLHLAPKYVKWLQTMDHAMIHVLIASTYTPVCLIPLRGVWGWSLLGMIWSLAIFGILLNIFWKNLPDWFSVTFYIFMGWLSVIAIWPMIQTLQIGALVWIFLGGFFYTIGAIIHSLKKPNPIPNVVGAHEIFHLFVLLGSAAHFWVMYNYITKFS